LCSHKLLGGFWLELRPTVSHGHGMLRPRSLITRRSLLRLVPVLGVVPYQGAASSLDTARVGSVPASFPGHDPAWAREMVGVAHGNLARVRALLDEHPALAKASWDWGFGDWETTLGAASHMGRRDIAEVLLAQGATPTIFSAAMLGELEVVRAFVAARPGAQRMRGPHGIHLMAHAGAGGPAAVEVARYLETLGGADLPYAEAPLAGSDREPLAGRYAFGPAPADAFVVTPVARGLTIRREGAIDRNLFHLGERVFHPAGAESVRIRFGGGEHADSLTVEDGPLRVTARRVG
jgi:hypothetical protein